MARGSLRLVRTLPTLANWRAILRDFAPEDRDIVFGLSESAQERLDRMRNEGAPGLHVDLSEAAGRLMDFCEVQRGLAVAAHDEEREAVAQACKSLGEDSPFFATARFAGLHRRLRRTLEELRDWQFSPDDLERFAERIPEHLGMKLRSLAQVERASEATLQLLGKIFLSERLKRCLSECKESEEPLGNLVAFTGSNHSPLTLDWIQKAVSLGAQVVLVLDGQQKAPALFSSGAKAAAYLWQDPEFRSASHRLASVLFTSEELNGDFDARLVSAADPLAEVEWALRDILKLQAAGAPFEKISLYARNMDDYAPLISAAAGRLEVPLSESRRDRLSANSYIRFLLELFGALSAEAPIALEHSIKSSYIILEPPALAESLQAIRETSFEREKPWESLGATAARAENLAALGALVSWREESSQASEPMAGWIARLSALFELIPTKKGNLSDRDEFARAALINAISTRAAVRGAAGSESLSLPEFIAEIAELSEQTTYPVAGEEGGVSIASQASSLIEAERVYVLGMLEGMFPRRRSEDPILSDYERQILDSLRPGRPDLPNSHDSARTERDEFVCVCASASKGVVFSFPQTDEERDNVPAFYLSEVKRAFGGKLVEIVHPRNVLAPPVEECLAEADRALSKALRAERSRPLPNRLQTERARVTLKPSPEEPLSPSELRDVSECAFRYLFRRRLGVKPSLPEGAWSRLRHLPQTVGLPSLETPQIAREKLEAALESDIESLKGELSPSELKLMRAGGRRLIKEWVEREFRARELWPKDKGTVRPHAAFGGDGLAGELPIGDRKLKLRGAATAISSMGNYAVAHLANARRSLADSTAESMGAAEKLELGVYFWALWGKKQGVAVEAESISGHRTLFMLPRLEETQPESRQKENLKVVALESPREFFGEVKESLKEALRKIDETEASPTPGNYCAYCDFGELCRCAQGYGESDFLESGEEAGDD